MSAGVGDDVLRWASEVEAGSWSRLSDVIATCESRLSSTQPQWLVAAALSDLGHLDIDWESRRWSVAPPCLAVTPGMGICGYLAGWRTATFLDRLADATDGVDLFPFEVEQPDVNAPKARFVKAASFGRLEDVASELGIRIVYDPTSQLIELVELPFGDELEQGAAPPPDEELHRFDDAQLTWVRVDRADIAGLYRFELHGRRTFRLLDASYTWRIADRAAGQLHVLKGRGDILRVHKGDPSAKVPSAVSVPGAISLPPLAERALVAASGLLPRDIGGRRTYLNVGTEAATNLASRLRLDFTFADPISLGD